MPKIPKNLMDDLARALGMGDDYGKTVVKESAQELDEARRFQNIDSPIRMEKAPKDEFGGVQVLESAEDKARKQAMADIGRRPQVVESAADKAAKKEGNLIIKESEEPIGRTKTEVVPTRQEQAAEKMAEKGAQPGAKVDLDYGEVRPALQNLEDVSKIDAKQASDMIKKDPVALKIRDLQNEGKITRKDARARLKSRFDEIMAGPTKKIVEGAPEVDVSPASAASELLKQYNRAVTQPIYRKVGEYLGVDGAEEGQDMDAARLVQPLVDELDMSKAVTGERSPDFQEHAKTVLGTGVDMALDPLTYMPGGAALRGARKFGKLF